MFLYTQVTLWQDRRDSSARIPLLEKNKVGYRWFLLNPNRISDMIDLSTLVIAKSRFLFSDNHRDRRENNSLIECLHSPVQIEATYNTAFHSQFITLPFYPHNNRNKTPIDTTLDVDDIAYFDADQADPDHYSMLVYNRKAYKRVEQLVGYSLREIEDILETGATTTTTTTTTAREGEQ